MSEDSQTFKKGERARMKVDISNMEGHVAHTTGKVVTIKGVYKGPRYVVQFENGAFCNAYPGELEKIN